MSLLPRKRPASASPEARINGFSTPFEVSMELHARNRQRLCESLKQAGISGIVILEGGKEKLRYDTDHEPLFRQESYFQWTFGVREPGFYGSIDLETERSTLYAPVMPAEYAVWMGAQPSLEEIRRKYSVDAVCALSEMVGDLKRLVSLPGRRFLLRRSGVNSDSGMASEVATFDGIENFQVEDEALHAHISHLRSIKTPLEVEVMRHVQRQTCAAHVKCMQECQPGWMEYQIESLFKYLTYSRGGCRQLSYTAICGSGSNSAILHYGHAGAPNDRQIQEGDLILCDMGAEYHGYASDVTVTFPVTGAFSQAQRVIYEAVLDAQDAVLASMCPGVPWPEMHRLAEAKILSKLKTAGWLQGELEEMKAVDLGAVFMPHGLGHLIGIDTHDVGGYGLPGQPERINRPGIKSLRTARVLEAGMVLTVEPGCYLIDATLDACKANVAQAKFVVWGVVDALRGLGGVRLEDNVVVVEGGCESLTKGLVPRKVEDVEAVAKGAPWPTTAHSN